MIVPWALEIQVYSCKLLIILPEDWLILLNFTVALVSVRRVIGLGAVDKYVPSSMVENGDSNVVCCGESPLIRTCVIILQ